MKAQNAENHKRYYIPHHLVFYPIVLLLVAMAVYFGRTREGEGPIWLFLGTLAVMLGWLSFMVRQHYAITLQNRIILSELRYRYFVLTRQRFERFEALLSKEQLFALRFAPDEEFPALVEKAVKGKLTGTGIKKTIVNWKADRNRV